MITLAEEQQSDIPLNVIKIVTKGYWQTPSTDGYYRIIVTQQGWEHLSNQLAVEWIQTPQEPNSLPNIIYKKIDLPNIAQQAIFDIDVKQININQLHIEV